MFPKSTWYIGKICSLGISVIERLLSQREEINRNWLKIIKREYTILMTLMLEQRPDYCLNYGSYFRFYAKTQNITTISVDTLRYCPVIYYKDIKKKIHGDGCIQECNTQWSNLFTVFTFKNRGCIISSF